MNFFLFAFLFSQSFQIFFPILILTYRFWAIGPRTYPTLLPLCPKSFFSKTYTFSTWFESSFKKENFGTKHDSLSFEIKKLWAKNVQKTTVFSRFSIFGFFSLSHIKPILQDKNFKFGMWMFGNKTINCPTYGMKKLRFKDCWDKHLKKWGMVLVL